MIGLVTEHDIAISGHPGHPLLILLLITFKGEITSEKAISVNGNMAIHLFSLLVITPPFQHLHCLHDLMDINTSLPLSY